MAYQNFFATRLYADIGSSDTTITLENPPSVTSGRLVLEARNTSKREIISYTGVSGNDITGVTRGVGGTSATDHIKNSLVEMNVTAEDLEDALSVPSDIITRFDEIISDHVASGLIWTDDIGLTADMSAGVAYINGIRLDVSAVSGRAFTASRDTYVDLGDNGVLDYNEAANGDPAPAIAANHLRLAKVVTDGTDTTSISYYTNPASLVKADGWQTGLPVPDTITYNGNRSYDLTFNSVDLTDIVSEGMRLKGVRKVTPPTQCTDLEQSSSQYWSKTSPSGISFTTTFTCAAWVKLESYTEGGIIGRRNGSTEGWTFMVLSDGTLVLGGYRIAANNKTIASRQSLPLNKWIHVAACIDMTAGDTSAQKIWIDGVEVPRLYTLNGTATALVQGTTALVVGAKQSDGTSPFDGKIAQASVHNACLSTAQIKAMASQTISSSTPSIVSGFTFNGVATDVTANANNLSAQGGAGYTTDQSFNINEFGIITAKAYSTNTTLTVQVPEGYSLPTSGDLAALYYSTQDTPHGFPRDKSKWAIRADFLLSGTTTSSASYNNTNGRSFTVPIGSWSIGYNATLLGNSATPDVNREARVTLSTSTTAESIPQLTSMHRQYKEGAFTTAFSPRISVVLSSATAYYLLCRISASLETYPDGAHYLIAELTTYNG